MPPQEAQDNVKWTKGILTFWDVMMRVTSVASSIERVGQQGHVPSTSPAVATAVRERGLEVWPFIQWRLVEKLCPMPGP